MGKHKQKVMKIYLDRTFEEKTVSTDANHLLIGKDDSVRYEPACVLDEMKPRFKFWRGPRKLVLVVDGAVKALKFAEVTDEMMPLWTKKEATIHADKEISKAHEKRKTMSNWQFVILLIFLLATLGIVVRMAMVFGAF